MSLFEKLNNKRSSLHEVKDDKNIKVNIQDLTKKAKKNPLNKNVGVRITDTEKDNKIKKINKDLSQRRTSQDNLQQKYNRQYDAYDDGDLGNPNQQKNTVKQSEVSKKAKDFTSKVNKANKNRQQTVRGRRATRIKDATGGKKTGSLRSGNLSFAGDRSGATKLAKADIDFKKGLKSAGGSGDIGFKAPGRKTKITKRITRASKLGLKDPFQSKTKFSQKEFDKSIGGPKKLTTAAPKGEFGVGDTKGQMNVKGMDAKAFKVTRPRDVKLPQSSTNFDRIKKEYRANVAKTSSSTGRQITKLTGGYGPAGPPQKGTPKTSIVKVKDVKPKSGPYSMVGTGKKEVVSRKKFVQSVLKSPEYVKSKESTPNPSKFINKDTGKTFDMSNQQDKEKYLRQYGKDKFINQKGFGGGSGGSGGGGKKIIGGAGGAGGSGGGGGRFKGFASKAASKGKGFGKGLLKFAKNNKFATAAVVGAAGYYGFQAIKRKIEGPQLDPRKDFTKTGPIRYGSNAKSDPDTKAKMKANKQKVGDKVRFSYSKGDPDRAKPVMTPSSYSKFKNKIYTVKDSSGKNIDVNKRIQNSAFTKQLTKASTKKNQSAKDFMRKYQKAAEFRGITT